MPPNTHRMAVQDILQRRLRLLEEQAQGRHQMLTVDKWEQSSVHVSPLTTPWTCQELHTNQSTVVQYLKQKSQPVNSLKIQAFISLNYHLLLTINLLLPVSLLHLQLSHWTRGFRALLKDNLHHEQVVGDGLIYHTLLNPGKTITSEKCAQEMKEEVQESPMPMAGIGQKKGPIFSKTMLNSTLHN